MKASDVMTTNVVTVQPDVSVKDVADILVKRGISAVPVVNERAELVGIVSEGDLLHRTETGTVQPRSWWLRLLTNEEVLASRFVKANARKVQDIMTRDVVTVGPDTSLGEIATLLEKKRIKRVPVVKDGKLVGIVSRANLVQALAAAQKDIRLAAAPSDAAIRDKLLARLNNEPWAHSSLLNVVVENGVVDLWGIVRSAAEQQAVRVAAETTAGVRQVNDHLIVRQLEGAF
ncbi:MAG: CBS domain-containing protein [Bradyrhizobiaceae bacterium]|nr:CBS domain-containing protein [Bradyrhizobiaceae bacterium]